ncbi:MAG: histidine kinase [Granulosicoccus sp.]
MNLKVHLLLRIIVLALLCLLVATAYMLYSVNRDARHATVMAVDAVEKHLILQRVLIESGNGIASHYPNLDLWQETSSRSGLCVRIRSEAGNLTYSSCVGSLVSGEPVPSRFASLYTKIFNPGHAVSRKIVYRETGYGRLTVTPDKSHELEQAWSSVLSLSSLTAITVFAVCLLVYFSINQSLRPVAKIVSGLEELRSGNLNFRLPDFWLAEWQRTGVAINALASSQQLLLEERRDLSRQLVDVQEKERRYLSRELHDELGQCLAAVNAIAMSIEQTAREECPTLQTEAQSIRRINNRIMDTVRALLVRLRPTEVEELGLGPGLENLVGEWERRCNGKPGFKLELIGDCRVVPEPVAVTAFRIVQECLSNTVKHADASSIEIIVLARSDSLQLEVNDDGVAACLPFTAGEGIGLLGIGERIAAFNGSYNLEIGDPTGLRVRVELPYPVQPLASI